MILYESEDEEYLILQTYDYHSKFPHSRRKSSKTVTLIKGNIKNTGWIFICDVPFESCNKFLFKSIIDFRL